jgi:hypothetical protein
MTVTDAITVENVTLPRLWSCLWAMSLLAGRRQWRSLLARLEGGLLVAGRTLRFKLQPNVVSQLQPHAQATRLSWSLSLASVDAPVVRGLSALIGRAATARFD